MLAMHLHDSDAQSRLDAVRNENILSGRPKLPRVAHLREFIENSFVFAERRTPIRSNFFEGLSKVRPR